MGNEVKDLFSSRVKEAEANARITDMLVDGTDSQRAEIAKVASVMIRDGVLNGIAPKVAQTADSVEGVDKLTRTQIREGSFAQKILPPENIGNDRLTRGKTEDLFVMDDKEPDNPPAMWIPFETTPTQALITGSRYATSMARIATPKFEKDVDLLRTYPYDIRQIMTDNSIKDGQAAFDTKFMMATNRCVFNAPGAGKLNYDTYKVQWMDMDADLDRKSWTEATKILNRANKFGKFQNNNYIALMNNLTAKDFVKLGRDAIGGDLAQETFKEGMTLTTVGGIKILTTIKQHLVPDGYVYFFTDPRFLGHCYCLHDWEMYLKKEAWYVSFFSYWLGGFSFGNTAGIALARFGEASGAPNPLEEGKFLPDWNGAATDDSSESA